MIVAVLILVVVLILVNQFEQAMYGSAIARVNTTFLRKLKKRLSTSDGRIALEAAIDQLVDETEPSQMLISREPNELKV